MNRWQDAWQRYRGAVPSPIAVYRPALVGMAGALPSVVGICSYDIPNLDAAQTIEEYVSIQNDVKARMKDLNAEFGVKPFSPEAQAEWVDLDKADKELTARIAEASARRKRIEELESAGQVEPPFRPAMPQVVKAKRVPDDIFAIEQYRNLSGSETELMQAYRDGAMFAAERAIYPNPKSKPDVEKAHIQDLLDNADAPSQRNPNRELARLILVTGSPAYFRAFTKYLQGRPLSPAEQHAAAPLTVQTDATGGFFVPFYFDPTIMHTGAWVGVNPYRATGAIKTIVGTDTYNAPTAAAFTVARAAEAAAAVEGAGAVGQISAIVGKVHGFAGLSLELAADRPDIVSELASLIGEAKDTEEESSFSLGIGDALGQGFNPIGMFAATTTTGAYTEVATAGNNVLAATDADLIEAALPIRHRGRAAWYMTRATIRAWQALETSSGKLFGGQQYPSTGNPANNPAGNTGLRLLGYPIWEAPSAPSGTATGTIVSTLVNPETFYIVERAGMTLEVIPHIFDGSNPSMPLGRRGVYAWWRNTAKPANVDGGRRLRINGV